MFAFLRGNIIKSLDQMVVIEVNGIGYEVMVPLRSVTAISSVGQEMTIFTYLHVREDAHSLYGFMTEDEKELFKLLLSVTGIGPKSALAILGGMDPVDFKHCIESKNDSELSKIPGIGQKTASRLILELRDKLQKMSFMETVQASHSRLKENNVSRDAVLALTGLGYSRGVAQEAVDRALDEVRDKNSLEELIRTAIQNMTTIGKS